MDLEGERQALLRIAFRMLGTVADAEDAVQEAFVRWLRLEPAERAAIDRPEAWLTRVLGNVCLDAIGSARARRERTTGEWLPEPVPGGDPLIGESSAALAADPADRIGLEESVSTALLVVLESLTPAERVALVLHDVFGMPFAEVAEAVGRSPEAARQLASQARRSVRERDPRRVSRAEHDAVVAAFGAAASSGELGALVAVLDPAVELRDDGGGVRSTALRPVHGPDRVARFLLGLPRLEPDAVVEPVVTADGLGFLARVGGEPNTLFALAVAEGRVTRVWAVRDPAKLRLWA